MTHQVTVSDSLWEQARKKWDCDNPATYLRDVLSQVVYGGVDASAVEAPMGVVAKANPLSARWEALNLGPDPRDIRYHKARRAWIAEHDSELAALEAAERVSSELTRDKDKNMRGWIIWWYKELTA